MPDYNPGLLYQGVQDTLDKYDQINQSAKAADAMMRANPALAAKMGLAGPQQFSALSAQDKIAALTGFFKQQGANEATAQMQATQAQAQEARARASYFQSFGQERQAQTQAQAQDDQAASNYAQTLDRQISNPDPNDPQAVAFAKSVPAGVKWQIKAAANAGRSNPRVGAALVRPLMQYFSGAGGKGTAAPPAPKPIVDPRTGETLAVPYVDPQTGKTTMVKPPSKSSVRFRTVYDSLTGEMKPSVEADNVEDFRAGMNALNSMMGGAAGAGAPAAGADKTNATPGEPPPMRTYQKADGTLWNYTGSADDPLTDTNTANWVPAPASGTQ